MGTEYFANVSGLRANSQARLNNFIEESNRKIDDLNKRKRKQNANHGDNERAAKKIKITALESDSAGDVDKDSSITALPTEIMLQILQMLYMEDVCRIARTCKEMSVLCEDETIWQERAKRWKSFRKSTGMSWKQFNMYAYKNACAACKKETNQKDFFWPLLRLLCSGCRKMRKYSTVTISKFGNLTAEDVKTTGLRHQRVWIGSAYDQHRGAGVANHDSKYRNMYLVSQLQELNELKKNGELTGLKLLEIKKRNDEQLARARINHKLGNAVVGSDIK